VFFAAWLYYTKSCFRRVRGFLRSSPEPNQDAENFGDKFTRFGDSCVQWYVTCRGRRTTIQLSGWYLSFCSVLTDPLFVGRVRWMILLVVHRID
jgi:hypothetical protein